MRLLIDGYDKQVKSLCANIRFCTDLQVLVYDPDRITVEGMDLVLLQNVFTPNMEYKNGETQIPCDYDNDFTVENDIVKYIGKVQSFNGSWCKSTLDIEKALEWCDCYACMESIEWDLITARDYNGSAQKWVDKLNRIDWIKNKGKKLYLSHKLDDIFKKESDYENMFNTRLDKARFEHMKELACGILNSHSKETDVKLVVAPYSASGKLSLCLKMKEWYDTHNERTGIIFTENIADLINSDYILNGNLDDSLIINASREWSDLSLDEWIEYVQYCVAWLEQRGCKHILLQGQGTYGIHELNNFYINKNTKTMNLNNTILEHAIGCNSVAIAFCVSMFSRFLDYYRYFKIGGVKLTDVYLSTYNHQDEFKDSNVVIKEKGKLPINKVSSMGQLMMVMNSLVSMDSDINFFTSDTNSYLLEGKEPYRDVEYINYEYGDTLCEFLDTIFNHKKMYYEIGKLDQFYEIMKEYTDELQKILANNDNEVKKE